MKYLKVRIGTSVVAGLVLFVALALDQPARLHGQALEDGVRVVTLEEARQLAIEHDPSTVSAYSAATSARANLLESRGSFLPTFTANGIYSNSSNERFDQTTGRLISESYTAQLQGSYEIFGGGRRLVQHRASSRQVNAADAVYRSAQFQTMLRVTEAYYEAAASQDLVSVAEQRLIRARQQLEFAQARLELGTATASDELRAELEVGNAELAVLEATSSLQNAARELGRLIGSAEAVRTAPATLPEHGPSLPEVEALIEGALESAPSVVAAEATLQSRRALRLAAYTPYLPSLRVSGGYDWFSFEFPPSQQSWSLRLFASVPIFNGFQREAAIQRASAAESAAIAAARDASIAVRSDVASAAEDVTLAERRVEISKRAVQLAREDLRVVEERYRIGAATILDLQASQVALAEAEIAEVRARQGLGGSIARLEAVLGRRLVD